jgi:hypothetical protein
VKFKCRGRSARGLVKAVRSGPTCLHSDRSCKRKSRMTSTTSHSSPTDGKQSVADEIKDGDESCAWIANDSEREIDSRSSGGDKGRNAASKLRIVSLITCCDGVDSVHAECRALGRLWCYRKPPPPRAIHNRSLQELDGSPIEVGLQEYDRRCCDRASVAMSAWWQAC